MLQCHNCKTETMETVSICTVCNYPLQGTEKEQASFIARQVIQKSDVSESMARLKNSRILLFAIGAFYLIVPFTPLLSTNSSTTLITSLVLGVLFVSFAFLTYKKPLMAIGIPLGLTLLYYLILFLINPLYLWSGILWKIIVLTGLGYGFISVRKSNKILKENSYLATLMGYGERK